MSLLWLLSSATLLLRISLQYQACPNVRGSEMKSRIWTFSLMNTVILINTSVKFHLLTSINLNFQTASLNALLVGERADIGSVSYLSSPPQITHFYKVSSVRFSSLEGTFHKRFVVHKEVLLPICSVLELVFINRLSIMGQSWRTNGNICSCMSVISTSSFYLDFWCRCIFLVWREKRYGWVIHMFSFLTKISEFCLLLESVSFSNIGRQSWTSNYVLKLWPIMNSNCETYFSTKHAAIKILQELRVLSTSIQLVEFQTDMQRCRFDNT